MRILALFLSLAFLLQSLLIPVPAWAEGEDDPLWNRPSFEKKVYNIGQRLLQANGISERIAFRVDKDDEVNAYASRRRTGNRVVVFRGLLDFIDSDDELAALLGHEIAHITKRHHARAQARRIPAAVIFTALAGLAAYNGTYVPPQNTAIATQVWSGPLMKSLETEADTVGVDYMVQAGYNPVAMETLMSKITSDAGMLTTFFASHPLGEKRLDTIREHIVHHYPEFLTSEIAANPPGMPYAYVPPGGITTTDDEGESAPVEVEMSDEEKAFYDKLAQIAETGSSSDEKEAETAMSQNEGADAENTAAGTEKPASAPKARHASESGSKQPHAEPDNFYDKLARVAEVAEPEARLNAAEKPSTPKTDRANAHSAASTRRTETKPAAATPYKKAPQPVTHATPANALRKAPERLPSATVRTQNTPEARKVASATEISEPASVAQLLLGLKPDELRLVQLLSREEMMDRDRLKEEFAHLDWTAMEILLQKLQKQKLIRIVGADPSEFVLLSDWAAAELNTR